MSSTAAAREVDRCISPDGLLLVRTLRGDAAAGCGQARTATGETVFARWEERTADIRGDERDAWSAPEREYRVLSSLPCAGVPEAIDLRRTGLQDWSVTSWIDGIPLGLIHRERLGELTVRLTAILARAHWAGWVHGDIKPANIVVGADGAPHVVDWAGARRIGDAAPPGTLGYAPRTAWSASHEARPSNDVYALAVTLWEMYSGGPAFVGDRTEVLDAQAGFDFPLAADAPAALAALVECARRGGDLPRDDQVDLQSRTAGARASTLARQLARHEAIAVVLADGPLSRAPTGAVAVTSSGPRAADADALAGAVADAARIEARLNVFRWGRLVAAASRRIEQSESDADDGVSRADRLRNSRARVESQARQILAAGQAGLVVATEDELSAGTRVIWDELVRLLGEPADAAARTPRFVAITPRSAQQDEPPRSADATREVVEQCLCTTSVSERLVAIVGRDAGGSVSAAIGAILGLAASGDLEYAAGCIDLGPAAAELDNARRDARAQPAPDGVADPACSTESVLARGELAAADGRLADVVRACIRVHTELTQDGGTPTETVLRLADLWIECGRSDAAETILRTVEDAEMTSDCALRLGRVILNRGDAAAAAAVLDMAEGRAVAHWQVVEAARLRALVRVACRDFAGAHALLRPQFRRRRELPVLAQLWLTTTLGNVARMRGRPHSARRILRWVKQRAARSGSVRLQIAASTNLVIAQAAEASRSELASEAWRIAQRCFAWGMATEGVVNALTATTAWVAAGEGSVAARAISDLVEHGRVTLDGRGAMTRALERIRLAAMDVEDKWEEIEESIHGYGDMRVGSAEWLYSELLQMELGREFDSQSMRALRGRSISREARCVGVTIRSACREGLSVKRWRRVLQQLGLAIDGLLPIACHAARATIRMTATDGVIATVLKATRSLSVDGERERRLAISYHAMALVGRSEVDSESVRWFLTNGSSDERRRPAGVRVWEWRLATARARAQSEERSISARELEGILTAAEQMMGRLSPGSRAIFAERFPTQSVARIAGLEGDVEQFVDRTDADVRPFHRIRIGVYQHWVTHGGLGGRAEGLERVLSTALKLRSAVEVESLLGEIALGVMSICRAQRAVVVYDAGRNQARAKVASEHGVATMAPSDTEVSLTAVAKVRESGRACLFDDACGDDDLGDRPSVMRFRPRSLIIAPLQTLGEHLGYVYVENRSAAKSFTDSDVELVEGFAAQAALALENAQLVGELRRSCEELERARKDAIRGESLRVLGRMASEVAHDFNNLLTAIIGETQLLMHETVAPAQSQSLRVIERAALDGAEVIRRIQDSTRVKEDKAFDIVPLVAVLDNVLDMIRWRAHAADVRVTTRVPQDLHVRGVASELREVFTNLVVNALDAMPQGGEIRIAATVVDRFVTVVFEDTGCGMSTETLSRVFDPFFTTKGDRGNGLGLSIAYGIMQRHGGEIRAESVLGRGSRMIVSLPLAAPRDAVDPGRDRRGCGASTPPAREDLRVLVVDDEPTVARILAEMLRRIGATPEVSIGGNAALSRIARGHEHFDVVITDVNMPDRNGIDVAREILTEDQGPRVIVMSGSLGGREEDAARMLGVSVLRKPFTISDVDRVLFDAS